MKISPVKNYKKPAYALKLAALLTAAASVSGCAENSGTAVTAEEPAASNTAQTQEDTAPAYRETTTAAPETTISGTVTTVETTTECLDDTELAGETDLPEETTSSAAEEVTAETAAEATTTAALTTAAVTTAATAAAITTTTTTTTATECVVDGLMEAPEENYTEPELEGDVAVPEDNDPMLANYYEIKDIADGFIDADVYYPRGLYVEFLQNDGVFESNVHVEFVNTYEEDYSNNAYIVFADKNDPIAMSLYGDIKDAKKVSFGYLAAGNMYGDPAHYAIVLTDGPESVISADTARSVVNTMLAEGWISEYVIVELDGDVEAPEEEVDTASHDYAVRSIETLKTAFKELDLTAVIPNEDESETKWVGANGYSIYANLDVGLNSSFVSYTPIYLSFIDTNDKETLDTLKKMGATEYKYGFYKEEAGFNGDRIMIVFVEVASFDGKLGANAAKKLVAELKTTAALEFEAADAELEGEPVIDEEN